MRKDGIEKWTATCQYRKLLRSPAARKGTVPTPIVAKKPVQEIIELDRKWIRAHYGQFMVDELKERATQQDGRYNDFFIVPKGKQVKVQLQKKVRSVKYTPSFVRYTVDHKRKLNCIAMEHANDLWEAKKANERPATMPYPQLQSIVDGPNWPPLKEHTVKGHWTALSDEGDPFPITGDEVLKLFGERYHQEVMHGVIGTGFCHVPVGDYKPSTVKITHPFLCVASAPKVKYQQEEGTDLCAFKSLASVLHVLGWEREAEQLDLRGASFGKGSTSGFDYLKRVSVALLPGWLQIRRIPKDFSDRGITPTMVAVLVLKASDGNCSHAVTTHGGFLYDANEEAAIPFCKDALDYCCSTEEIHSEFIGFARGWIFEYRGKVPARTLPMSQPNLQHKGNDEIMP